MKKMPEQCKFNGILLNNSNNGKHKIILKKIK
jgi:hypothetical protein